ncbi:MAG: four helix bundle protein [Chloroflexi bacterium]|nr:four helix bundle protein [Chloroflexota bacterium]
MKDFRKLQVWQKSHHLALAIYRATKDFPKSELYSLTSQMRRSATSIPSNIAEGSGRGSDADLRRMLQIAFGSASKLEYQLLLAQELEFINKASYQKLDDQITEIKRMLSSLMKKLKADR